MGLNARHAATSLLHLAEITQGLSHPLHIAISSDHAIGNAQCFEPKKTRSQLGAGFAIYAELGINEPYIPRYC